MPDSISALHRVRAEVGRVLAEFLARQRSVLPGAADELGPGLDALTALLAGGKRLRPAFCYWGWRGTGAADGPEVLTAAAALELLHAGALVHDLDLEPPAGGPGFHMATGVREHDGRVWLGSLLEPSIAVFDQA